MYAYRWIRNHLVVHTDTCLPKQCVFDAYRWVDGSGCMGAGEVGLGLPPPPWRGPCLDGAGLQGSPNLDSQGPSEPTLLL